MVASIANVSPFDSEAARAAAATPSQDVGEQEFLTLLMTQLMNQDPLDPMDSAKFLDQINSLNMVKQLVSINEGVGQLMLGITSLNNQTAVDLVGKVVVARGDTVVHEAGASSHDLYYELAGPAETVEIIVRGPDGDIIDRFVPVGSQDAGEHHWTWLPADDLPEGEYTFEVTALDVDEESVDTTTFIRGIVEELRFDTGVPVLIVGGNEITLDGILRVLAPEPESIAEPEPEPEPEPNSFQTDVVPNTFSEVDSTLTPNQSISS
jgi:flagellar basal-body rod modification protein FlgD